MSTLRSEFTLGRRVRHVGTLAEGTVIDRPEGYQGDPHEALIVYVKWDYGNERIDLPKHMLLLLDA